MNSFHVMWLCCWILFVGDIGQRFPSSQLSSLCPFSSVPFCFIKKWSQENEMCTQRQQGLTCAWINHVSFWYKLYVQINTFLWRLWSFFFKHFKRYHTVCSLCHTDMHVALESMGHSESVTSIRVLWISLSAEVPSEKRRPPTGNNIKTWHSIERTGWQVLR